MEPLRPRKRTRAQAEIEDAPVGQHNRRTTEQAMHRRRALNRCQMVLPNGPRLMADQHMAERRIHIHGGSITYRAIHHWRRGGVEAIITARMIASNMGTAPGVHISGETQGIARGHLLARVLGGDGNDLRNLVPVAHEYSNIQQYHLVEKMVEYHVLRHKSGAERAVLGIGARIADAKDAVLDANYAYLHRQGYYHEVLYRVTPLYAGGSDIYPSSLDIYAECQSCRTYTQRARNLANALW